MSFFHVGGSRAAPHEKTMRHWGHARIFTNLKMEQKIGFVLPEGADFINNGITGEMEAIK
jgi:hypothetical protein